MNRNCHVYRLVGVRSTFTNRLQRVVQAKSHLVVCSYSDIVLMVVGLPKMKVNDRIYRTFEAKRPDGTKNHLYCPNLFCFKAWVT
jgi:hypothetical protein